MKCWNSKKLAVMLEQNSNKVKKLAEICKKIDLEKF